jgi:hypothetical protein
LVFCLSDESAAFAYGAVWVVERDGEAVVAGVDARRELRKGAVWQRVIVAHRSIPGNLVLPTTKTGFVALGVVIVAALS